MADKLILLTGLYAIYVKKRLHDFANHVVLRNFAGITEEA